MKYIATTALIIGVSSQAIAADNPHTQAFLDKEEYKNVFIQATAVGVGGKKLCYGPLSPQRAEQPIVMIDGKPTNVYEDAEQCVAANGELTQYEQNVGLIVMSLKASEEATKVAKEKENIQKFFGINFGLGLAFTRMSDPQIREISLNQVSGTEGAMSFVNIDQQTKNRAVAMLESHYFFKKSLIDENPSTEWGHGPFIAIGIAGEDGIDPLSTYGGGWMWGIRRNDGSST